MSAGVFYSNTNAATTTNVGTAGQILTSNGVGSAPSFQAAPAGGITTINGDTGSVTGATISLLARTGSANAGATVRFTAASATELDFGVTNATASTIIGLGSGNGTFTGVNDTAIGTLIFPGLTTGNYNCAFGYGTLNALTSGSGNCGFGNGALVNLVTGSNNVAIGPFNGTNLLNGGAYTSSESSNIVISNAGVAAESNVIRIGTQGNGAGQQNLCFVAGITGVTTSNSNFVTVDTTTGQLGAVASAVSVVAFSAYLSGALSNATGDGTTVAPIIFDTEQYDLGSWYNNSTGIATIPSTGAYQFIYAWGLTGVGAAHLQLQAIINNVTAGFNIATQFINPFTIYDATSQECCQFLVANAQCTAGDQIQCSLQVSGSTKTVTIWAAGQVTAFSGTKIG